MIWQMGCMPLSAVLSMHVCVILKAHAETILTSSVHNQTGSILVDLQLKAVINGKLSEKPCRPEKLP